MIHNSLEIEQSVLGGIFLYPDQVRDRIMQIDSEDFEHKELSSIFGRVKEKCKGIAAETSIDRVLLLSLLSPEERPLIVQCMEIIVSVHNFDLYLARLKELSKKRRLRNRVFALQYEDFDIIDLQKIIEDEEQNHAFENSREKSKKRIERFIDEINEPIPTIKTGFSSLDKVTGGIRKGTVFYIGARPSTGKTALAINIAENQLKSDNTALLFSLEMSSSMIYERVISSRCGIPYNKFSTRTLTEDEKQHTIADVKKLRKTERFLVLDDVYTVESICNTICELKPDLAVVDFIQIVTSTQKFVDTRTRIDYISGELKRVAKTVGCVIMVLSQLTRNGKDAPTMSDLKESGALEQDGDYVALLHRPYVLNKKDEEIEPERTEFILDKNKFGRTGVIPMRFDLKFQKFYEVDQRHLEGLPFE